MPLVTHILSFGYDRTLMPLRSMVLRGSRYVVKEAYSLDEAFRRAKSDAIDLLLICHTVPEGEQKKLISLVRSVRRLLPILCITKQEFAYSADGCVAVTSSRVELLQAIQLAAHRAY